MMVQEFSHNMLKKQDTYKMTVDLNVLDHLGINLYSNIAAVLTEVVANAWDADANRVEITISSDESYIEIKDDGVGMSIDDMNSKYLRVGYRRREVDLETGSTTAKGRLVMGRKGLGKLSLFSIAKTIEVQSSKDGQAHGLRMTMDGIHQSVKDKKAFYCPETLAPEHIQVTQGTTIILRDIRRQRLGPGAAALKKRLGRRFSIIGAANGFEIFINNERITAEDRGDLPTVQFLWSFGKDPDLSSASSLEEQATLPDRLKEWDPNWSITGWIGTARTPKQLNNEEAGNLNGIVVFARGRLFHENILEKFSDGRLYTKYLTGQLEADFLDADDQPDIATSGRQRIQEDDPRYKQLIKFLETQLIQVEKGWKTWRTKHEVEAAKRNSPALTEWLTSLPKKFQNNAETLIAKLSALPLDDESDRKLLYRHGVLAFERMKLRNSTDELVRSVHDSTVLLSLLADRDALEASMYRDIVKTRLEVIKNFRHILDEKRKEVVLQTYLFEHLWLLDPAWEHVDGSELMESRLTEYGVITEDLSEKERLGRVDIAYKTTAGKHIIIELKRVDRQMKLLALEEQGRRYVDTLEKILLFQGEAHPNIEVIFVLGKPVSEEADKPERLRAAMEAISPGSRIVHYDRLLLSAQKAYSDIMEKSQQFDKLDKLIERI